MRSLRSTETELARSMASPALVCVGAIVLALLMPATSVATDWYVPDDAGSIAEAIGLALPGDRVILRADTYPEYNLTMKSGITLMGETGDPADVVIDASYNDVIIYCPSLSAGTEIRGITFTHGYAYGQDGAGMHCYNSDLTVEDCVFWQNETFFGNGAGVAVGGGTPTFLGCRFDNNTSDDNGGGMYVANSSPTITDCSFLDNTAYVLGGGLYLGSQSSPTITGTIFAGNYGDDGGGMSCSDDSDPDLASCTFYDNATAGLGAAIACYTESYVDVDLTIVADNTGGEPFYCDGSPGAGALLTCCDVWGNPSGDYVGCIAGQNGVNGNFSADPMFCNPEGGNLRVHEDSPCANAPGCGVVGALGIGCGPRIWYVPDDAPTIAAAIDSAFAGDTIIVRTGTYGENSLNMKSGVVLESETGNPDDVVVDGEWGERVFTCTGLSDETEIRGITITNGWTYSGDGGGMYCGDSYLTVEDCVFSDNETYMSDGGGVAVSGGNPTFLGCIFASNSTDFGGGGMHVTASSPTITDCWFASNVAYSNGGGLYLDASSPTVTGSVFGWNDSYEGGGIYCTDGSSPDITNCTFYDNTANTYGGALVCYEGSHPDLANTIIAFHGGGEPVACDGARSSATLSCCDVYGNTGGNYSGCLAGQGGVNGNFSEDPLFCEVGEAVNLQLAACSPCADAPGCGLVGALGVGCGGRIWVVPTDAPTIAAAIDSAAVCDTVYITEGVYLEHGIYLKSGVTVMGEGGPTGVTVDGEGLGSVFFAFSEEHVILKNMTITNGYHPEWGAGLQADLSYVELSDVIFDANHGGYGGGFSCLGDSAHITDCVFTGNTASLGGGAYLSHWGDFRLTRCEFNGNTGFTAGGGLVAEDADCTLDNCAFMENDSGNGAGLYFRGDEIALDLADCSFSTNDATGNGGGLYARPGEGVPPEISLLHCRFFSNTAGVDGGGAFLLNAQAMVAGCTFHGNDAAGLGDGIEVSGTGSVLLMDHTILTGAPDGVAVNCTGGIVPNVDCSDVYGNGGGDWVGCLAPFAPPSYGNFSLDPVYCDPGSGNLFLNSSSPCVDAPGCGQVGALGAGCGFIWYVPDDAPTIAAGIDSAGAGDTVIVRPGTYTEYDLAMKSGLYLRSETLDPSDVTIDAQDLGRVFYCADLDTTTMIQGFTITGGDTTEGGAMSLVDAHPRVLDCVFYDNTCSTGGGALFNSGMSSPLFERCAFTWNRAAFGGGALIAVDSSDPAFTECTFVGNQATYGGAVVCHGGGSVSLTSCTFDQNEAGEGDGSAIEVISEKRAAVTVTNTIIAFGNVPPVNCVGSGSVTLTCCDVYGNAGGDYVGCIAGQNGINGNISEDPLFCGEDDPDNMHTLRSTSPCAAENNPACGQIGPYGIGCAGYVDWDAGGDGETWEDPDNWDPDHVPGENDHARIILDGTYTVYYNSISDIWALTHGATSGTQTLDVESGVLAVTHGATNTQEIIVRDGATFDASVGRDSSVVVNEADAVFTLDDGDLIGTGTFINRGLFEKIGDATSHVAIMFENEVEARGGVGVVEAEAGTLSLEGETNSDGRLNVNSGATAIVSQHFIRGDRQSSGALNNRGLVVVAPGGRLGADATLVIANEADGAVTLEDGDLIGGGTFVNRGLLEKIGSGTSHVLLTLENLVEERGGVGTVEADAGTLSLEGETNSDGRLNVNSGATAIVSQHFIGKQRHRSGDADFVSSGEVAVDAGGRFIVDASGVAVSTGTFETAGRTVVAPGASFSTAGDLTVGHGGALIAAGQLTNEYGGDLINNGLAHVPDGGLLTNDGYFAHRENGLLKGSGTLDNSEGVAAIKGLVAPGDSHGTLTYIGDFVQAPTSEISFEIGGYDQGSNYDLLDITGEVTFKGAVEVSFTGGFVPVVDDSFQIIAHGEGGRRNIDFDCFSGLGVSDTLYMEPIQREGAFLLRAISGSTGNARPLAADDSASVTGYAPITIDVLANDSDPDLDVLRVILLQTDSTDGIAYINESDSLVTYAAIPGFAGADSFDYVVTDCLGGADTGRVTIDVTAPPDVWHVPGDSPTIAGALALAAPGDTVVVECGTYYESDVVVPQGVTLVSETGEPDCVIIDASGRAGRGLYFSDVDSTTVVAGIGVTGGTSETVGGGMYCESGSPTLINCAFAMNSAVQGGGGAAVDGGSTPSFERCSFVGNTAGTGGGMVCLNGGCPEIDECLFFWNGAPTGFGGALTADELSAPEITSSTLSGNYALQGGGLYVTEGAAVTVDRTIIAFSVDSEAVVCTMGGAAELSCSDVYGNEGGDWVGCIEDQQGINGNFSLDPMFCGAEADDYHLLPDSPCADAEGCGLVGAFEAGCVGDPEIHVQPESFAFEVGEGGTATDVLRVFDFGRDALSWLIRENGPVPEASDWRTEPLKARILRVDASTALEPARPEIPHIEVGKGEDDPREGRGPARGAGGPDGFGYTWIDNDEPFGPTYDWREISGVGTALTLSDDDYEEVALPFAFPFYAVQKTTVRISSNGYLTFGEDATDYSNDPIPDAWAPNDLVAPFWDDLTPELGGSIYYHHDAVREEFIVQYDGVYDYYGMGPYTFEVVLKPNGSILFLYNEIEGDPFRATVGIENASGTTGIEIAFNAAYAHSRLVVLIEDPAPWLTEDPPSGVTSGLGDQSVTLEVDTRGLMPGLHLVTLVVESNDPDEPEVMIPVSLLITGTGVDDGLPIRYVLHGNYPNPFNPRTEIRYDLPRPAVVSLRVYSLAGRLVRELVGGERQIPGRYAIPWDGRDESGVKVASGVYYYKLEADGEALTNRMVLLK